MFERILEGLVFKIGTYEKGETFYTIILKNRFIPGINKTARLYINWEDDSSQLEFSGITKYDYRNYLNYFDNGLLGSPDEKEIARLSENIENLPEEIRNKMYKKDKIKLYGKDKINLENRIRLFPKNHNDLSFEFLLSKLKNAYSITHVLPL